MSGTKHFVGAALDRPDVEASLAAELEKTPLTMVLKWGKDRAVLLWETQVKGPGDAAQRSVLAAPIRETDGDIEVDLGRFAVGDLVEVTFSVVAIVDVPRAAAFVWQHDLNPSKVAPRPKNKFQELKAGKPWTQTFKYRVRSPPAVA